MATPEDLKPCGSEWSSMPSGLGEKSIADEKRVNGHNEGHGDGSGGVKEVEASCELELDGPTKTEDRDKKDSDGDAIERPSPLRQASIQKAPSTASLSCIRSGLVSKASPTALKSWIALSLTLDGRDKITKVLQYSSRLLAFYFESITSSIMRQNGANNNHAHVEMLVAVSIYRAKANRFRSLQKALTTSRKAYRLGRTVTELDKLRSMGLVHWISWYLTQMIVGNSENIAPGSSTDDDAGGVDFSSINAKTMPMRQESIKWHPNVEKLSLAKKDIEKDKGDLAVDNISPLRSNRGKDEQPIIKLPRRVSSNLSPPTILHVHTHQRPNHLDRKSLRQLSTIRRILFSSVSCYIDESKIPQATATTEIPPLWKIISSSFKLLGLAGFWAGDNISYLYSTGFLTQGGSGIKGGNERSKAKAASIFAARSYFFAAVSGLYLNAREWSRYRNGPLKHAMDSLEGWKRGYEEQQNDENPALKQHEYERELKRLEASLETAKRAHAKICIALLKSCCDTIVFSNNAGIDLHLKYRGKKMSEGIQCICGITSAMTVLYNNFPNKK